MASGRGVCQWALETAVEQTGGCTCRGCSPSRQLCRSSPPCRSSQAACHQEHPNPAGYRRERGKKMQRGLKNMSSATPTLFFPPSLYYGIWESLV